MKNYNTKLTKKQQKYQHYHQQKYEYFTGEEILPSDKSRMVEQAKFIFSPLGKPLEKQTKN